jgi:multicomponent Na+:H+ antiporter subunit D
MSAAIASAWPVAAVALPVVAVAATLGWSSSPGRWRPLALCALSLATAATVIGLVPGVLHGRTLEAFVVRLTPQAWLHLRVDAAGAAYGVTVAVLFSLALVYSLGYLRGGPRLGRYYGVLMSCFACTLGVAYAGNLLTFLVFYELFSVLSYALVVHDQTRSALAAGTRYIVYILAGGSLVLAGVLLTFFVAGDLAFRPGGLFPDAAPRELLLAVFWCFVGGFGVKAALVPLHGWVPEAHPAAPAPFSAVLSGVMVAAGGFGIMRVAFEVFGVETLGRLGVMPYLGLIAAVTVVVGALLALFQDDLKRRLAYSTISQMGYFALALSLLGPVATLGALVHLTHHAFLKGTLFFCAGSLGRGIGHRRVSGLGGGAARMPLVAAAFTLASFGMIGIPPLSGFVSKWWLGVGMLAAGSPWGLIVLLGGALLSAGYLLPVVFTLYFGRPGEPAATGIFVPATVLVPTLIAALLTLAFGLGSDAPGFPVSLARRAVEAFFAGA